MLEYPALAKCKFTAESIELKLRMKRDSEIQEITTNTSLLVVCVAAPFPRSLPTLKSKFVLSPLPWPGRAADERCPVKRRCSVS